MLGQGQHILAAGAQRGQMNLHDVEPVVEIFAQVALAQVGRQIAIGGGDHPHVHPFDLVGAKRPHLTVLQNA